MNYTKWRDADFQTTRKPLFYAFFALIPLATLITSSFTPSDFRLNTLWLAAPD
jgi:hypothetical protein